MNIVKSRFAIYGQVHIYSSSPVAPSVATSRIVSLGGYMNDGVNLFFLSLGVLFNPQSQCIPALAVKFASYIRWW